jgi:hypothetical protein
MVHFLFTDFRPPVCSWAVNQAQFVDFLGHLELQNRLNIGYGVIYTGTVERARELNLSCVYVSTERSQGYCT